MFEWQFTTNPWGGDGKYGYVEKDAFGNPIDQNGNVRSLPGW